MPILQVKHSKTSSPSSYKKDFCEVIDMYTGKRKTDERRQIISSREIKDDSDRCEGVSMSDEDDLSQDEFSNIDDGCSAEDNDEENLTKPNISRASKRKEMSVEYLENDMDVFQSVDDWDGTKYASVDFFYCIT